MTTVCFKDGVMASDSKCSDDFSTFLTKCRKIDRLSNGALLGNAGDSDSRSVVKMLSASTPKRLPSRQELADTKTEFSGILAFPNARVFMVYIYPQDVGTADSEWTAQVVEMEERMCAVGSGYQFALGAMAAGKSAVQAVHVACRYDSNSQAPVRSFTLNPDLKKTNARPKRRS